MVMPLWLNLAPAKVLMPALGTRPVGRLFTWQVSQGVELDTGTCAGVRLPMLRGVTPAKLPAPTSMPWQLEQLVFMPAWLNSEPEKRAPLGTGVAAMLEPVPTWQLSQPAVPISMWSPGGETILGTMLAMVLYVAALASLWQLAQPLLVLAMLAWISATVGITE